MFICKKCLKNYKEYMNDIEFITICSPRKKSLIMKLLNREALLEKEDRYGPCEDCTTTTECYDVH